MSPDEIRKVAIDFAKKNKNKIANDLTDLSRFVPDDHPISVFMAGSPGAGKTEFSKELLGILEADDQRKVVRIDGDDLRERMPGYVGNNSALFQGAVSIVVEKIHDFVLDKKQSLSSMGRLRNMRRLPTIFGVHCTRAESSLFFTSTKRLIPRGASPKPASNLKAETSRSLPLSSSSAEPRKQLSGYIESSRIK